MSIGAKSGAARLDEAAQASEALSLDAFIGYNLKRAYILVQEDFRRALAGEGLSARTFSALAIVMQYPDITQAEVARLLGVDRSGMVAITDDLQARGYLIRRPDASDRRVQALAPTEAGRLVFERTRDKVQAHEQKLFAHFSAEEQQTLLALLRKIRNGQMEEEA